MIKKLFLYYFPITNLVFKYVIIFGGERKVHENPTQGFQGRDISFPTTG